ncbi:MAG: hypothetical protein AAFY88_09575, partial [Acidobacteriota bacterium]
DGGPTVLTSPVIDHSAGGGVLSYRYWVSVSSAGDFLVVEVTDDGATWVEARRYEGDPREWKLDAFHLEDFISPSAQTQVRLTISDNPNNALVEAGVDSVSVITAGCTPLIFSDDFESGDFSAWSGTVP